MRKLDHDLAHRLAAEYALGTLRGRARSRFEAIARADAGVEAIRRQWEAAFAPLAERVPAVEPPARVWARIEERIGERPARGAWSSLSFWRSFGLMAGGVASVLFAAFLYLQGAPRPAEPAMLAVLSSPAPANEARMVISFHAPDTVHVKNYRPWPSVEKEGKGLELWVLDKDGAPRSLGMIPNVKGEMKLKVRLDDPRLKDAHALALSSEPMQGSPTKQPTGRVLCSGSVASTRKV
ncbi:MAG TPA: anti-sigma factor [Usitatibacter sp.]|nr:anti-sigma factor [Usitatibacter sp.]